MLNYEKMDLLETNLGIKEGSDNKKIVSYARKAATDDEYFAALTNHFSQSNKIMNMKTKSLLIILGVSIGAITCKTGNKEHNNLVSSTIQLETKLPIKPSYKPHNPENKSDLIKIKVYNEADDEFVKNTINSSELSDTLRNTAIRAAKFVKWYINDSCPIDQDKLFTFSDSLGYYIFDSNYGYYYINELQKTALVSENLMQKLTKYFEESKIDMKIKKLGSETDGAIGYEADIIFNGQDLPAPFQVQEMKIKRIIIWSVDNVTIGFGVASVDLIYENG